MNFNNGNDNNNNKNNNNYVRAVRGGKSSLLSFRSVFQAYLDCRKRKRGTINALKFEENVLENLFDLAHHLQKGSYQPARSICFVTRVPKLREIFAADFRDRVVHHLLVRDLEKRWDKRFIFNSFASRKEKGTHLAIQRLQKGMLQVSCNRKRPAYFMQLDIRSFFMSIDRTILFSMFASNREQQPAIDLLHRIIFHDCTQDFRFKGDIRILEHVPPHKSLFQVTPGKGLPIGNLTSQFFANVYLNELDQYVMHTLRCAHYFRYVDDFILLADEHEKLLEWYCSIEKFLQEKLQLTLKPLVGQVARRVSDGANFLGYIVRPDYILIRNRVVNNFKHRLNQYADKLIVPIVVGKQNCVQVKLGAGMVAELRQVVASYMGHFKHGNAHRLVESLFLHYRWLDWLFTHQDYQIRERFKCRKAFLRMRQQVNFFRKCLKHWVLFFQVGQYIEAYDDDAVFMQEIGGFTIRTQRGIRQVAGFPIRKLDLYVRKVLIKGRNVAVIREVLQGPHIMERQVTDLYTHASAYLCRSPGF
jgi:retron-type reverse transcriptase